MVHDLDYRIGKGQKKTRGERWAEERALQKIAAKRRQQGS